MNKCPYKKLNDSVMWTIKEFDNVTIKDISDITGWTVKSVRNEIRWITKQSIIGFWVDINKNDSGKKTYSLRKEFRNVEAPLLSAIGNRTFTYETIVMKEAKKQKVKIPKLVDTFPKGKERERILNDLKERCK